MRGKPVEDRLYQAGLCHTVGHEFGPEERLYWSAAASNAGSWHGIRCKWCGFAQRKRFEKYTGPQTYIAHDSFQIDRNGHLILADPSPQGVRP